MTCRTCKHRLDVTLWGCWLATGCRIGLVLRDESAKKRNDGRHPDLLRDQYARAREAACSGNIPRVRARLVSIQVSMNSMGVTPTTPRFPQGCITVLVTRPVTTEKRNAWGCLRVRATLLSLWPQG